MKSIIKYIQECLITEHADTQYKKIFGYSIYFSSVVKNKLLSAGLDFRHMYDKFVIYEDGCLEYTNPYLFTGSICAKIYKDRINRYINASDHKYIKIYTDGAVLNREFDLSDDPFNYIRAILNALTHRSYNLDVENVLLTSIDYTKGDFELDSRK